MCLHKNHISCECADCIKGWMWVCTRFHLLLVNCLRKLSCVCSLLHYWFKTLARRDMSDFRTLPSLSYHKPIPNLQLLCLRSSHWVQFVRCHSGSFKRGLECLNTLIFCVCNDFFTFYIFMLYILIHTVLSVDFCVVLWNRVYNLCTLYVLKGIVQQICEKIVQMVIKAPNFAQR